MKIYAVITGHGSDENGCGEFCVTSHHFVVNKHINNITFSEAGKTKQLYMCGVVMMLYLTINKFSVTWGDVIG